MPTDATNESTSSLWRDVVEIALVCAIALVFSRTFVFQQSNIPSGSMEETLLVGDYIMVNRFVYAPAPSPLAQRLLPVAPIRRGDVVVFQHPEQPELQYIKRVVGLPGDEVEIREASVWIDGERQQEPWVDDAHRKGFRDMAPTRVPEGHYFVLGDHRNSSSDSQEWGPVDARTIRGRAVLIWWSFKESAEIVPRGPLRRAADLTRKLVLFPVRTRWERCLRRIE